MNIWIAKIVLAIDQNIVKPLGRAWKSLDETLANYSITPTMMYLFVGVFSLLMVLSGHLLAFVGLPWLLLAAYRYLY